MNVHLDYARIGGNAKVRQARIARRLVAFTQHRLIHGFRRRFHGANEFKIIFQGGGGRHENIKHAVSRLGADRRARDPCRALVLGGYALGITPLCRVTLKPDIENALVDTY